MNAMLAFLKKEALEQLRTGRLVILGCIFALLGVMNPAVAKLTPWLLETMSDSLAQSGMTVTAVTITAMDSWVQFYKNIPMGLLAFVLLEGGIFTAEYQQGTLVLSLTKGLGRQTVVAAKGLTLAALWTAGYWMCYGITYGYNAWYWDNAVAQSLLFSAVCWWVFGLWVVSLTVLFSVLSDSNTGVFLGTGGVILLSYLLGMIPKVSRYLPTQLMDGNSLIYGLEKARWYFPSLIIALGTVAGCVLAAIALFPKKQL